MPCSSAAAASDNIALHEKWVPSPLVRVGQDAMLLSCCGQHHCATPNIGRRLDGLVL